MQLPSKRKPGRPPGKRKPTIRELEKILNEPEPSPIEILPDGSIRAVGETGKSGPEILAAGMGNLPFDPPLVASAEFAGTGVKLLDANQLSYNYEAEQVKRIEAKLRADFAHRLFVLEIPGKRTRYVPFEKCVGFELVE